MGGLWIIIAILMVFSVLIHLLEYFLEKHESKKKKKKNIDLFTMSSPGFDIKKKKKKWFLIVTDYIHIPEKKYIIEKITKELEGFKLFIHLYFLLNKKFPGHFNNLENIIKKSFNEIEENVFDRINSQNKNENLENSPKKIRFNEENSISKFDEDLNEINE